MYRFRDQSGSRMRPFRESADITPKGYSRGLQRALCDLGADHAFGKINAKLQEHYGITVPDSSARKFTEYHAKQMQEQSGLYPPANHEAALVIGECDGSMVPIVETFVLENRPFPSDRRKHKKVFWKEARLSMAHAHGSSTPCFAATLGSVEDAGNQLLWCVTQAGAHPQTQVHCVGDGAVWIANQVEEQFGAKGTYLIDFYHVCEYLGAAAPGCAPDGEAAWLKEQKERMKLSQYPEVLNALKPHVEPATTEEAQAPVRACYRYIHNRPRQLDYKSAQEQGLPIGSGEVESAHRYVIQARLKIAGAWWTMDNAKNMIALRTCRANRCWNAYWQKAA